MSFTQRDIKLPTDDDVLAFAKSLQHKRYVLPIMFVVDGVLPRQHIKFQKEAFPRYLCKQEVGIFGVKPGTDTLLSYGVTGNLLQEHESICSWEIKARRHVRIVGTVPDTANIGAVTNIEVETVSDHVTEADIRVAAMLSQLVEEWQASTGGVHLERPESRTNRSLAELGPMPAAEAAGDLAFWVAALLDARAARGVGFETRSAVLSAVSVSERLGVVLEALHKDNLYDGRSTVKRQIC